MNKSEAANSRIVGQRLADGALVHAITKRQGFPPGIIPHHRYLSSWEASEVRLALGHFKQPQLIVRTFDLSAITLQCTGQGIYTGTQNLIEFPNLVDALKAALNRALDMHHLGKLENEAPKVLKYCCATFSRLLQQGYYKLAEVPREELEDFAAAVAKKSLLGTLNL
jgi:hypothetical protein